MKIFKLVILIICLPIVMQGGKLHPSIQKNGKTLPSDGSAILSGAEQAAQIAEHDTVNYFAENGFGRPLHTLQHPSGEYYKGITYLAYQGPQEDPYVCAYNHLTKVWTGPFKAGTSTLGKRPNLKNPGKIDNHGRPALLVDGKGYIHLIFGGHGGDSDLGNNSLGAYGSGKHTHLVSKRP